MTLLDVLADELDHHLLAIELVRHRVLEDVPCQLRVLKYKIKSINSFGRFLYLHDKDKGEYGLSEANTTLIRPALGRKGRIRPFYVNTAHSISSAEQGWGGGTWCRMSHCLPHC